MKKMLVVAFIAMVGSAFAGEFDMKEFTKYKDNLVKAKEYFEANQDCKKENVERYSYLLAKIVPDYLNKKFNASNYGEYIEQLVNNDDKISKESKFNVKLKLVANADYYYKMPIQDSCLAAKKLYLNDEKSMEEFQKNYNTLTLFHRLVNQTKEYEKGYEIAKKIGNPYFKFIYSDSTNNSENIIESINELSNDLSFVKRPTQVTLILKKIDKLTNAKYDDGVKNLLKALNKTFYPKISENENWKKIVVQIQLKMKAYGI